MVTITFGFADVLTLAQTIAIIATLLITLYFSRKQIRSMSLDVETRVLNDLDEKRYRVSELMLDKPEFINVVAGPASGSKPENVIAYMVTMGKNFFLTRVLLKTVINSATAEYGVNDCLTDFRTNGKI